MSHGDPGGLDMFIIAHPNLPGRVILSVKSLRWGAVAASHTDVGRQLILADALEAYARHIRHTVRNPDNNSNRKGEL